MKVLKYAIAIAPLLFFLTHQGHAEDDAACSNAIELCRDGGEAQYLQDLDEKDWNSLYDYINTKRTINVQEKSDNLTISGDVRAEYRRIEECEDGHSVRSKKANIGWPKGHNDFDVQFNLRFDYVCNKAWGVAHLQFDNRAGVCNDFTSKDPETNAFIDPDGLNGSGTGCDIDLKKAYFGYNIYCDGATRFDVEVGRRRLYQVFDSEIQFLSRFDGALFKFDTSFDNFADWYLHAAAFVVDYRVNHYAWVGETGLLDICDTGFDLKYSLIDWEKNGTNFQGQRNPRGAQFLNSQITAYYNLDPELFFCMPVRFFGACLINHDACDLIIDRVCENDVTSEDDLLVELPKNFGKNNFAWYVGFSVGEVIKEGDWSFNAQYQFVEAQSIPNNDVSGIGNGNTRRWSFTKDYRGNTNFKGYRLEFLFAYTDNLSFDLRFEESTAIDNEIAGSHAFSQVKMEAIYAF